MTGKFSPQYFCVCCGTKLPGTRQELIAAGAATITGTGQTFFHCPHPRHSHDEIQKMIRAVPKFTTGHEYRIRESEIEKYLKGSERDP